MRTSVFCNKIIQNQVNLGILRTYPIFARTYDFCVVIIWYLSVETLTTIRRSKACRGVKRLGWIDRATQTTRITQYWQNGFCSWKKLTPSRRNKMPRFRKYGGLSHTQVHPSERTRSFVVYVIYQKVASVLVTVYSCHDLAYYETVILILAYYDIFYDDYDNFGLLLIIWLTKKQLFDTTLCFGIRRRNNHQSLCTINSNK